MNIVYDDDSSIAEFKIYEYLGTVLDTAIHNNGDGEAILSCAGISSLIPQYQKMLTPYSYNGQLLAQEVLEEIPRQVIEYYQHQKMPPREPVFDI